MNIHVTPTSELLGIIGHSYRVFGLVRTNYMVVSLTRPMSSAMFISELFVPKFVETRITVDIFQFILSHVSLSVSVLKVKFVLLELAKQVATLCFSDSILFRPETLKTSADRTQVLVIFRVSEGALCRMSQGPVRFSVAYSENDVLYS